MRRVYHARAAALGAVDRGEHHVADTTSAAGYGITEQAAGGALTAQLAERIRLLGYAVLPGGFSPEQIAELSDRLDRVMARQVTEFGGADQIGAIGDTLTARCPLV